MLILSRSLGLLFVLKHFLFMGGFGYAGPASSSRIACVVESKEAEISITLENRSTSKRKKILGRASAELKGGHFSNLKTEKNDVCVFSSVSREPGLEEAISIKYGEELSFLLKPNHELELTKLEIPQGDLKIIAPLCQFILADGANLQTHSLMIRAQEIKNRAFLKTQELHIKGGDLENYGSIKSLKGNLSILMNDNVLLNREGGSIHSKSNLSVLDVSTLTNKGIMQTLGKGMLYIEGAVLNDKGKIYYADKNFMNITAGIVETENHAIETWNSLDFGVGSDGDSGKGVDNNYMNIMLIRNVGTNKTNVRNDILWQRKRHDSGFESANDSGFGSDSDSGFESTNDSGFSSDMDYGRSRSSSISSVFSDVEPAEILEYSDNASGLWSAAAGESEQENLGFPEQIIAQEPASIPTFYQFKSIKTFLPFLEAAEFSQGLSQTMGEELVGEKAPARLPRRPMSRIFEAKNSSNGIGRSLTKANHHFNVLRSLIKNAQHTVSSTAVRVLHGGVEESAQPPGFEDKLASLDSMSSLREGASNNSTSKSFETPKEEKTALSKMDMLLAHVWEGLNTVRKKFSEMFFPKGVVYKFSMILWENFLIFKHWFLLCAICGLLFWGRRKMLLLFRSHVRG